MVVDPARGPGGAEAGGAAIGVEQRPQQRVVVGERRAPPVDLAIGADQRGRVPVAEDPVLVDRGSVALGPHDPDLPAVGHPGRPDASGTVERSAPRGPSSSSCTNWRKRAWSGPTWWR